MWHDDDDDDDDGDDDDDDDKSHISNPSPIYASLRERILVPALGHRVTDGPLDRGA